MYRLPVDSRGDVLKHLRDRGINANIPQETNLFDSNRIEIYFDGIRYSSHISFYGLDAKPYLNIDQQNDRLKHHLDEILDI